MRKLYLFDVDGTLISPGPAPRKMLNQAFVELTEKNPDLQISDVAGFTDPLIVRTGLERLGIDGVVSNLVSEILDRYLELLASEYPDSPEPKTYSDALALVSAVETKGHAVGLLTGNIRGGARIKLEKFNLFRRFPFGVFGEDGHTRSDLPRVALERAWEKLGESFRFEQMVIVGDTVEDCKIAVENGAQSVIVCRRPEWRSAIEKYDPTWVGERLDDPGLLATI